MRSRDSITPERTASSAAYSNDARFAVDHLTDDDLNAYSMDETARRSSIPRTSLYLMIKRGELDTIKRGRRRLVPAASLRKLVGAA